MRWKILRLSLIASMITDRPGVSSTIEAAARAASVAPETAMPQSSFFMAGASFTPSPVMPTMWPCFCRMSTMWNLCSGNTCAKPSAFSTNAVSVALSSRLESPRLPASRMWLPIPSFLAVSWAMARASPVTILTFTPIFSAVATVSLASSRGGSNRGNTPWNCHLPSASARATPSARKPRVANSPTALSTAVGEFATRGFRALGVARADADGKWQFQGVLPLFDPPRDDARETVATAEQMGVKVKMVTGDALAIAQETAKKLGMGSLILDAGMLGDSKHKESAEETALIEKADGFAQVFPEHKFHIVDILQQHGHIVGMTGDGVNDAPALKKADCGIAVSGATDAARAAAAIVLTTPGLSVIIDAIKESRRIVQRMNSYAIYRIAETFRVLLFMTVAILAFNFYPVTAIMIVMLALLNDGAILSIAYDNVHYKNQPEAWNMRMVLS